MFWKSKLRNRVKEIWDALHYRSYPYLSLSSSSRKMFDAQKVMDEIERLDNKDKYSTEPLRLCFGADLRPRT